MPDTIDIKRLRESGAPPKVLEVYKALRAFGTAPERLKWVARRAEAWKVAVDNEPWSDQELAEMRKTGEVPLAIPKLVIGVQGSSAICTANRPEIKVLPKRESDPYLAELLKWGIDYVWDRTSGNEQVRAAVEEREVGGTGVLEIRHDDSHGIFGRCLVEETVPTIWYWNPKSRMWDWSDTTVIKAQKRSKSYIKANYDGISDEDLRVDLDPQIAEDDGEKTDTVTGADNYAISPDKSDGPGGEDEPKDVWEIEAWLLKTEKEDWVIYQRDGEEPAAARVEVRGNQRVDDVIAQWQQAEGITFAKRWRRKIKKRVLRVIVGKKIIRQTDDAGKEVDELTNPWGEDSDGDPVLPVIPLHGQRTRTGFYMSPASYAIDLQKSLNKREAQFILAASKALNAPVVRDENSKWTGPPDRPGSELRVAKNAAFQPYRMPPGTVDLSAIAARIEEDKANIDEVFGLPEIMRGKIPKGQENMSGRLGLALQDTASLMKNPSLARLESSLVLVGKAILANILRRWPRQQWGRLIDPQDREQWLPEAERVQKEQQRMDPLAGMDAQQQAPDQQQAEEQAERERVRARWEAALDKIGDEGITLVDLDVKITAGSSLPTNRMAKEQMSLEKFQAGLYDRKAALEYAQDPHAKEISDRMDRREMMMAQAEMAKKAS